MLDYRTVNSRKSFEGRVFSSKSYGEYRVVSYNNFKNIVVEFLTTGFTTTCSRKEVLSGTIKDVLLPSIYGVGFFGVGKYASREAKGKNTRCYDSWRGMLRRCYSENSLKIRPSYRGCTVDVNWHNYQNFADWYYSKCALGDEAIEVDKDILVKGNKIYGEQYCSIVPTQINSLFTGAGRSHRGNHPIGVYFKKSIGKFTAQLHRGGNYQEFLGDFNTPEEAFKVYKEKKEIYIKYLANKYAHCISKECYNSLIKWSVDITD